jgi:putative ABC transport system permease protein
LHDKIEPLIITNRPDFNRYGFLAIRYDGNEPALLISQLTAIWRQTGIDVPFDFWFLDSAYHNLYKAEERFRQLFLYFSLVSIVLSLSGVLGLSLLNIQQKTKEIGIRKILGADVWSIVSLALKQFVVNILIAVVIAVPLAWIYTNFWLRDFAYRIVLVWWMFVLSGIVVLMLASIIIGVQAIRAARGNPIRSLRSE